MQAVILVAGASTRFYPLGEMPKCMIPLLGKPILAHTIASLTKMGITDIILVVGKDSPIKKFFADGGSYGAKIAYVVQEKPLGMGNALLVASKMIKEDFFLLNGHHFDIDEFISLMINKRGEENGVLLGQERENPWEYGVIKVDGDRVLNLVEKPQRGKEPSKICVVGIYLLTPEFLPFLKKVGPTHYQLESALDKFAQQKKLKVVVTQKKTVTLKYPWDLLSLKNYLLDKSPHRISRGAKIGKGVILVGKMIIEEGATIYENATIKGPVYIGRNVLVGNNALVREGASLEENSRVGALSEVKGSIFLPGSTLGSGFVASSIIG
ncbi:MAG: bifunctional UDP-N-acetylglucosamine pyrophosphorylase / Glucosamine-1-phosphate N-acetyltransferase, partial [Microgenomates group bacterium LiPW_16]